MKITTLACTAVLTAVFCTGGDILAHGGTYRGPGDTVPPGSGSGSGRSGNPGTPSTPTPGTPSTPTPGTPSTPTSGTPSTPTAPTGGSGNPGRSTPTTGGGFALETDLTKWEFWWEFNKDPFLQLKSKVNQGGTISGNDDYAIGRGKKSNASNTLAPNDTDRKRIVEVLKKVLMDPDSNRDVVSSCMMALAKIGGDASVLPLFKKFLPDSDQEKREVAALAMGITALKEAVPDLVSLAKDDQEGRSLVKRSRVDFRTRAFACYGLGLVAARVKDMGLQAKVFETMKEVASQGQEARRDEKVAALNAIRLLQIDNSQAGQDLRNEAVTFLTEFMNKSRKEEVALVRSHSVTALASLVGRTGDQKGTLKELFSKMISDRKVKSYMHQSSILGLGLMASPGDEKASKALQAYMNKGKDMNGRNFAAIALGQIGGEKNKAFLYKSLIASKTKAILKPWIAFGLAIADKNMRKEDPNFAGDTTSADAIHKIFGKEKNRSVASGLAVALGIMRYKDASYDIEALLTKIKNDDEPAGYLCVALGLLENRDSKDMINEIVDGATRREKLLTQASIALGLLGDKEISLKLVKRLESKNTVAVFSAVASALGFIGDRRSISPLIEMSENKDLQDLSRAFSCVALGLVGDKEDLPWNSKIAVNANYRANVETLTGTGTGILDIL
jgi:HEAT repeat protein